LTTFVLEECPGCGNPLMKVLSGEPERAVEIRAECWYCGKIVLVSTPFLLLSSGGISLQAVKE